MSNTQISQINYHNNKKSWNIWHVSLVPRIIWVGSFKRFIQICLGQHRSDWTNLHVKQKIQCVKYWASEQKINEKIYQLKHWTAELKRNESQTCTNRFTTSQTRLFSELVRSKSQSWLKDSLSQTLICSTRVDRISTLSEMIHWIKRCWDLLSEKEVNLGWIVKMIHRFKSLKSRSVYV